MVGAGEGYQTLSGSAAVAFALLDGPADPGELADALVTLAGGSFGEVGPDIDPVAVAHAALGALCDVGLVEPLTTKVAPSNGPGVGP